MEASKRERKLAEKKAKRLAKEGQKKVKQKFIIRYFKTNNIRFITNPDKDEFKKMSGSV